MAFLWTAAYSRTVRENVEGFSQNGAVARRFRDGPEAIPEQWLNAIETATSHCSVLTHKRKK
jgi:hypothetical protein